MSSLRGPLLAASCLGLGLGLAVCGPQSGGGSGTGGEAASGGSATGGVSATGGRAGTGGLTMATGGTGANPTGGAGGALTTGGRSAGGRGGSAIGGNAMTGGAVGTGGTSPPTGGSAGGNGGPGGGTTAGGNGFYQMEKLDRGVVAVAVSGGVYVGWRMFGFEYDAVNPARISYNVYRGGTKIASVTDSTNYLDADGTASSTYAVRALIGGVEGGSSETASVWSQSYLRVPLSIPPDGKSPASCPTANEAYSYSASDGSVGDLDGDGKYELVLKWDPSNSKDNSQAGCTGNVYLDAYELDTTGKRLWRLDLGPNIRAGAHYTQFVVADLDGDGRAEVALKTAPGTKDGSGNYLKMGPAASASHTTAYRNADGYVLDGPEYLTVFDGRTGAELATVAFDVARGTVSSWGDNYGNRVDRFFGGAAYLDKTGLPSLVMSRGMYTRTTLTAWNFRNGQLSQLWKFDSNGTPKDAQGRPFTGQGSHSMTFANVDDDPQQEIMFGAMAIDHDGKGLCSTGYDHGDAEHVGDLVPSRPGLEFFMCNEDGAHPAYHLRDARTCQILQEGPMNGDDTGRCVADDISPDSPGGEMWASSVDGLFSSVTGAKVGAKPGSQNFLIYWDADETRELEDANHIDKYVGGTLTRLLTANGVTSNNGTKSTPVLTADLLGDWREEIIWRETDNSALRLYTTTAVTKRRIYSLMHDPQYRAQVSVEQTAYNQPPHPGFHIGSGMIDPPAPNIVVK